MLYSCCESKFWDSRLSSPLFLQRCNGYFTIVIYDFNINTEKPLKVVQSLNVTRNKRALLWKLNRNNAYNNFGDISTAYLSVYILMKFLLFKRNWIVLFYTTNIIETKIKYVMPYYKTRCCLQNAEKLSEFPTIFNILFPYVV